MFSHTTIATIHKTPTFASRFHSINLRLLKVGDTAVSPFLFLHTNFIHTKMKCIAEKLHLPIKISIG